MNPKSSFWLWIISHLTNPPDYQVNQSNENIYSVFLLVLNLLTPQPVIGPSLACGSALHWTLFVGTDGPATGTLTRQTHSPLLPREANSLILYPKRESSRGHVAYSQNRCSSTREPQALCSLWREVNIMHRMGMLFNFLPSRNDGPLAVFSHKLCAARLSSRERSLFM